MNKEDLPKNAIPLVHGKTGEINLDGVRFRKARKGEKAYFYMKKDEKKGLNGAKTAINKTA